MPSSIVYTGNALPVAQVTTLTIAGAIAGANTISATVNTKTVTYTYTGSEPTTTDVANAFLALLQAETDPEYAQDIVFTSALAVITCTARNPGVPFVSTAGATGTATLTAATPTASSGPRHWGAAANWSTGAVPVTGDSVYVKDTDQQISFDLNQSAVTLALLDWDSTGRQWLGLPDRNVFGYTEYRGTYLQIGATTLRVGKGDGGGPALFRINLGSVQCTGTIFSSGSPLVQGDYSVRILGTHASNAFVVQGGSVGFASGSNEVMTIATAKISAPDGGSTSCAIGYGSTLSGTVTISGGTLICGSNLTTLTNTGGTVTLIGTATVTTLNNLTGTVYYQSSGTCGTYLGGTGSTVDFTRDLSSRTFTNTTLTSTAALIDPAKTVTFTNPISVQCKLSELTAIDLGEQFNLQRS